LFTHVIVSFISSVVLAAKPCVLDFEYEPTRKSSRQFFIVDRRVGVRLAVSLLSGFAKNSNVQNTSLPSIFFSSSFCMTLHMFS